MVIRASITDRFTVLGKLTYIGESEVEEASHFRDCSRQAGIASKADE